MNAYQSTTERITKLMESGSIPWVKPWSGSACAEGGGPNTKKRGEK